MEKGVGRVFRPSHCEKPSRPLAEKGAGLLFEYGTFFTTLWLFTFSQQKCRPLALFAENGALGDVRAGIDRLPEQ
jgi:hypothetical protein